MKPELIERRLAAIQRKHTEARDFALELAALEGSEWDLARKADIARRRREVEVQASYFQKIIAEIEEDA
jgi:hypothetical protein